MHNHVLLCCINLQGGTETDIEVQVALLDLAAEFVDLAEVKLSDTPVFILLVISQKAHRNLGELP